VPEGWILGEDEWYEVDTENYTYDPVTRKAVRIPDADKKTS